MYHPTDRRNRDSIAQRGLLIAYHRLWNDFYDPDGWPWVGRRPRCHGRGVLGRRHRQGAVEGSFVNARCANGSTPCWTAHH